MIKLYTIEQGEHRSGIHFRPHLFKKFLEHRIKFDDSSVYYHGNEDQYDINKLFGLSYGLHHTNSVRFGWRSIGQYSPKIEILAYCYIDGQRVREDGDNLFIAMVDIDKFYNYRINVSENSYTLTLFDGSRIVGSKEIRHRGIPCWGYHLYPYFGGNRKAPHNINIYFES